MRVDLQDASAMSIPFTAGMMISDKTRQISSFSCMNASNPAAPFSATMERKPACDMAIVQSRSTIGSSSTQRTISFGIYAQA
jgi:hypothetical protein